MDDKSNNNPLFQQEFCFKQKLCLRAHVSVEAESLRKQKYAEIILLTHVLCCINRITYVVQFLINRESRYRCLKTLWSNIHAKSKCEGCRRMVFQCKKACTTPLNVKLLLLLLLLLLLFYYYYYYYHHYHYHHYALFLKSI